jgi:hypothetical protein
MDLHSYPHVTLALTTIDLDFLIAATLLRWDIP